MTFDILCSSATKTGTPPTHIEHSATMANGQASVASTKTVGRLVGGSRGAPVSDVNQHGSYGSI